MGRRLFFLLTSLSLLLCLGTAVLWVRSYKLEDVIIRSRNDVPPPQPRNVGFGGVAGFGGGFGGGGRLAAALVQDPKLPPSDESFLYLGSSEQGHALWLIWSKGWWRSNGRLHWQSNYSCNRLFLSDGQHFAMNYGPGIASGKYGTVWLLDEDRTLNGSHVVAVQLPLKWIVLTTSLLPMAWLTSSLRRRRQHLRRLRLGLCTSCSYDLTANTSGVCPECGTAVARKPKPEVKAMRRMLFTAASAVSLLLCLGTVALWLGTFRQEEFFQWVRQIDNINPGRRMGGGEGGDWVAHSERVEWRVLAGRGRVCLFRFEYWFSHAPTPGGFGLDYAPPPGAGFRRTRRGEPDSWFDNGGYGRWFDFENNSLNSHVQFPIALPAATTAILPLIWLALALGRLTRQRKSRCQLPPDLTGNTSG